MIACGAGAAGGLIGLISLLAWPVGNSETQPVSIEVEGTDNLDSLQPLAPLPQRQKPSEVATSDKDPALAATVDPASVGVAQSYNDAGELVDVEGIDPYKTQAEQGIDDKSGYTFPCVFVAGDLEVCQRKLTAAEAAETGF